MDGKTVMWLYQSQCPVKENAMEVLGSRPAGDALGRWMRKKPDADLHSFTGNRWRYTDMVMTMVFAPARHSSLTGNCVTYRSRGSRSGCQQLRA